MHMPSVAIPQAFGPSEPSEQAPITVKKCQLTRTLFQCMVHADQSYISAQLLLSMNSASDDENGGRENDKYLGQPPLQRL